MDGNVFFFFFFFKKCQRKRLYRKKISIPDMIYVLLLRLPILVILVNHFRVTREEGGHRLPCPKNCPKEIYQWILDCWNQDSDNRPSFKELYDRIEKKWMEAV